MEPNSDKIVIGLNRKKIAKLFIGSVAFVALSCWLLTIADTQARYEPAEIKIAAFLGVSFFGITTVYSFYKLFDKQAGLIIDEEGIHDNSSAIGSRLLKWGNITGFDTEQIKKVKFLIVYVNNAEQLMEAEGKVKRWIMSMNHKKYGTPIAISATSLNITFDELIQTISNKFEKYKSK